MINVGGPAHCGQEHAASIQQSFSFYLRFPPKIALQQWSQMNIFLTELLLAMALITPIESKLYRLQLQPTKGENQNHIT